MKVGNIVDGLAVIDVKRINKMNLIQFTKAVSEYVELGYKLDVNSSRQIGLVLQMDVYKLENNLSENVGSTGEVVSAVGNSEEEEVAEDETEYLLSSEANKDRLLESVERIKGKVGEEAEDSSDQTEGVDVEQPTPTVKKTRAKKTT